MFLVDLLSRLVHVGGAIVLLGSLAAMAWCVRPVLGANALSVQVERRLGRVLLISSLAVLASGFYNWWRLAPAYSNVDALHDAPLGNMLIGIKFLMALVLFSLMGLRGLGWIKNGTPKLWTMIYLHLGALVLILAAVIRYLRLDMLATPLAG